MTLVTLSPLHLLEEITIDFFALHCPPYSLVYEFQNVRNYVHDCSQLLPPMPSTPAIHTRHSSANRIDFTQYSLAQITHGNVKDVKIGNTGFHP